MVKTLSREDIQRMIRRNGSAVSNVGSGGGGGGITLAQVDAGYVSKAFFNQLFTIHGKRTYTDPETEEDVTEDVVISPNQIAEGEYSLSNVEVSVGLWTNSFLSALGIGSGGGGGGTTALTNLVDVAISNPQNGQVLTYDATLGKWKNADAQGGGGADMQTVWAALAANTSEQINASHLTNTLGGYLPLTGGMMSGDIRWHTNSQGTDIGTSTIGAGDLDSGGNAYIGTTNRANLAFGSWNGISFWNRSQSGSYPQMTTGNFNARTGVWNVVGGYQVNGNNVATEQWVNNQGFLKNETYVGTVTSVAMTVPTGFIVTGSPITSSGTLALTFASGYSLPTIAKQSNWDTAYGWGNHAGLYLQLTGGTLTGTTTFNNGCWNIAANEANEISNKHWENNTLYNNDNTAVLFSLASIRNALRFRWYDSYWNIGNIRGGSVDSYGFGIAYEDTTNNRLIDCFHVDRYGTINSLLYFRNSSIGIGTSNPQYKLDVNGSIHSGSYVQIGNIRLVYDSTYNALQVIKSDGTAANFYATGGVSALGMSAGTSAIDAMAFNYLTVNNRIYFGNTNNYIYHDSDGINVHAGSGERLYVMNQIYTNGGIDSDDHIYLNGNHLYMGGGRIYLDSTRYLYVSGSTLYYYNGSQTKVIG